MSSIEHEKSNMGEAGVRQRQHHDSPQMDNTPSEDTPVPFPRNYISQPLRPNLGSRHNSTISIAQVDQMLPDDDIDMDSYGVSELRDGFFDAIFLQPFGVRADELMRDSKATLPVEFDKSSPLAAKHFLPRQLHQLGNLMRRIMTTRAGVRLLKTFIAFYIAYILCLVPLLRDWLGRYHYMMAVSVIINHPARTIGAQIEGTIFTTVGTAAGLAWGVVGLLLSTSTLSASAGYGGILAMFLALFMATMAWIRSFFIRFYQGVLCAGIAIMFTTLAETNSQNISWPKLRSYAIPWFFGQSIALVVNCVVFPDTGARALATSLHQSFDVMQTALDVAQPNRKRLRRRLADSFVGLAEAYRDMTFEITISRFRPDDVKHLRNKIQAVLRAFLALETENFILANSNLEQASFMMNIRSQSDMETPNTDDEAETSPRQIGRHINRIHVDKLQPPTLDLLRCMKDGLQHCDAALMDISGYRNHTGPPKGVSSDIGPIRIRTKQMKSAFDMAESTLLNSTESSISSIQDTNVVRLLVFARHVREAVATVENVMEHVEAMQQVPDWPRLHLPSYPLWKAIHRTNAQVRHDRGGVAAGSYQKTFIDIARQFDKIKSRDYQPVPRNEDAPEDTELEPKRTQTIPDGQTSGKSKPTKKKRLRYKLWRGLYRLQGYETKYAFKVCMVISLLAIPSYLNQGKDWWDMYEAWWAVVMSWAVMHPRVGGNIQDLVTRAFAAILGAVWSGVGYAAGNGNPYVMAVFAALYMIPMLYRYTISSHPRSGLAGCLSFAVISLSLQAHGGGSSPAKLATLKGVAFFVGTAAPIIVNWLLWPFVARHELRDALSSMLFFMSILYRSVVARYVYFQDGRDPTSEDILKSEILEGRLREGFVRIRQLLVLTRHEIRLRAPFNPLPYSALADSCERFFDYVIAMRHSALFYNPSFIRDDPLAAEQLLSFRRDAAAAILGNLYILAGALRSQRKAPKYMPSAAAARKRLLVKTAEVEEGMAKEAAPDDIKMHKKWSDIYSYSFNESLTGCVAQLEELEKYTKLIVGEQGFDDEFQDNDEAEESFPG